MAGDEGKKVKGDIEDSMVTLDSLSSSSEESAKGRRPVLLAFAGPCTVPHMLGNTSHDQVTEEETAAAYVYKMDKPWLTADEIRVEIRRGRVLQLIGRGDETAKVKLRMNSKMSVREVTASLSADGVLTVVIPKRYGRQKWREYADSVFMWFKTVRVGVSS